MKTIRKEIYSVPRVEITELTIETNILAGSGRASLFGAGVDESNADSNGTLIW
ncbi:MAG: hypothetical protein J5498_05820 [Bacteroidales bacterium]|nr:hypothetical protein [Bacteroidales bacterium]MBR4408642.1 hypothetical protein [Bacteroidales bacterium]MBR5956111.1 hypothetical protein [Bacteroidales bacterium]